MKKIHNSAEQFCHDILNFDIKCAKPLVGIIMALCSEVGAKSPTELSNSPFFQYSYSILSKVMKDLSSHLFDKSFKKGNRDLRTLLAQHFMKYAPPQEVYRLISDFTPIRKAESAKLRERTYVQIPNNKIPGNKPLDIGYYYSYVNLGLYDAGHPVAWSLPLDNVRLEIEEDKLQIAANQLIQLMDDEQLPFKKASKVVNAADSGYATTEYIHPLVDKYSNLLLLIRFRAGTKVYGQYQGKQAPQGRTKAYEEAPYYLQTQSSRRCFNPKTKTYFEKAQTPIFDLATDEEDSFETTTHRGRKLIIQLYRWNDLLISGTRAHKMSDKPFDLVAVRVVDKQTGQLVFKREMYLTIWGKERRKHLTSQAYWDYRHRYDIESHNRFSKQAFLADKYQTPCLEHLDAWLWTVQMAWWLLYNASTQVDICVNPWERYLPQVKRAEQTDAPKSAAMTRRGAKRLFSTFDLTPFKPQESKNGTGRKKGDLQIQRTDYKPRRKNNTKEKIKLTTEKIE